MFIQLIILNGFVLTAEGIPKEGRNSAKSAEENVPNSI
jgi:hypothetical protein